MLTFLLWLLLFILCWPLALLALVLWPIVWLVSIPFRLLGIAFEGVFGLLRAVLLLPVRLLEGRRRV
jgi:hypothetical protein